MRRILGSFIIFFIMITASKVEAGHDALLPSDDLFMPLLADPKYPRFFASYRQYYWTYDFAGAAIGFGENFGMYRYRFDKRAIQLNIQAGLFALFELNSPSYDLIDADYILGFPVTYRDGKFSMKFDLLHQSSHLGDEFMMRGTVKRKTFLYDLVGLLASYEWQTLRGYFGGQYLFHRIPSEFDPGIIQAGVEFYGDKIFLHSARLVGGIDLKSHEEHNWYIDTSLKAGVEFRGAEAARRRLRVLIEGFKGFSHWGQFYSEKVSYYGIGLHMSQ